MLPLVFCLMAIATSVAGQLQFNATQADPELKMRCSLPDMQSANLAHIISLGISKIVNGQEEILASFLSVGGSAPVLGDLDGGVVDAVVTFDGPQCYIEIEWPDALDSLAGEYRCELGGLDQDNNQVTLQENLQVSIKHTEPKFVAWPHHNIDVGLTRELVINCSVTDFSYLNLASITSIDLSYLHNNIYQQLATVSVFDPAGPSPGSGTDSVFGYVGNNGANYLETRWTYPGVDTEGEYECEVMGIDNSGIPVHFTKTLDLSAEHPERQGLIDRIKELDITHKNLTLQSSGIMADSLNISQGYNYYYNQYVNVSNGIDSLNLKLSNVTNQTSQMQAEFDELNAKKGYLGDFYILACDFEADLCGLNQLKDDYFDWIRHNGSTDSSATGPSDDHSLDSINGYYIYLEASNGYTDDAARLETPVIPPHTRRPICVSFYYHMYGSGMGTLNVYSKHGTSLGSPIWTLSGNKGDRWFEGRTVLPVDSAPSTVVFEGKRGSDYESDIALDDILISDINC